MNDIFFHHFTVNVLISLYEFLSDSLLGCFYPFYQFFKNKNFSYLYVAALDLYCFVRAFSSCGDQGLLFIVVHGLLIAVASFVGEHEL